MAALPIGYSIGPKTGIGFGKHDAQIQLLGAPFVRQSGRTVL
jgi:hypothetical protein